MLLWGFTECLESHRFWPYAAHLTAFFIKKGVSLDKELCKAIPRSNVYNLNFLLTFMKFRLVDGVLQRTLISPTSFSEVQEQVSTVHTIEEAPVPDVPHVLVHEDSPSIIELVQPPSPIHTQDEPLVSPLEPQPSMPIETPTPEQQVPSQPIFDAPIASSSPSQLIVEPTSHESSHEPIQEPIQIEDSPQHLVDTYCPPAAYA